MNKKVMQTFLFLGGLFAANALDGLHAEGNPHVDHGAALTCCPAQSLPPSTFLAEAAMLEVQADTFIRTTSRTHLGVPVPVFDFHQPVRLSAAELPFRLVLVASIDQEGIVELEAPAEQAADSFFPGYAWSRYVVCAAGAAAGAPPVHLGWRFTRKAGTTGGPADFVAMIVRADDREAEAAAAGRVGKAVAESIAVSAAGDVEEQLALRVGQEAPGWMVAMLAAVTARAVPSRG